MSNEMLNCDYYKEIYEDFVRNRPDVAEIAEGYRPRGDHSIRVTTSDGLFDYNYIRGVGMFVREKPKEREEITKEYSQRIFADRLRDMMTRRNLNQKMLAERTGLSESIISRYLRSDATHNGSYRKTATTPTYHALRLIAWALDCEPYELM